VYVGSMSVHDTIQRIYEEDGLDDLWHWAKGHTERWAALREWADNKVHVFDHELDASRERREKAEQALDELGDQVADLSERIAQNREQIAEVQLQEEVNEERLARLRGREQSLIEERQALNGRIDSRETREHKVVLRAENAKKEKKAWIERKIIYHKEWEEAKRREKPEWKDFMASGHPLNFSAAAKAEAAIAVVKFDCVVTSTFRSTVIADSNPNSFHGPNVNPGEAVDVAGARMSAYQKDVFDRRRGDSHLLELFGPTNNVALKNGAPTSLAEGTSLENIHDTHVHVAAEG
jgi:hypothetical protein